MWSKSHTILTKAALASYASMLIFVCCETLDAGPQENIRIIFDINPDSANIQVFGWLERENICWGINTLAKLADTIQQFAEFTQQVSPGQPNVLVTVMLPEDHDWMTPGNL